MLLYPPKGLNFTTREKCFIGIYQKMSKFKRITKMLCEKCNIDMMYLRGKRLLVKNKIKIKPCEITYQKRTAANLEIDLNFSVCPNFNQIILCVNYFCVFITFNYKEKVITFTD